MREVTGWWRGGYLAPVLDQCKLLSNGLIPATHWGAENIYNHLLYEPATELEGECGYFKPLATNMGRFSVRSGPPVPGGRTYDRVDE